VTGAFYQSLLILYFGQAVPQGEICSDDFKLKFAKIGKGYVDWITAAIFALEMKDDIAYALHNASKKDGIKSRIFCKALPSYI
jgi:hypothetical protein